MRRAVCPLILLAALIVVPRAAAQGVPPDIEMQPPYDVVVTTPPAEPGRTFVAFSSRVINRGPGVLKVYGERKTIDDDTMDATQVLLSTSSIRTGHAAARVPVGEFQFSPSADHNHWHYLRFEDYNLLSVPDLEMVAPTRKTGFCLLGLDLDFWCGHQRPNLLRIGGPLDFDANDANPGTNAMGMVADGSPDTHENGVQVRASEDEYVASVEGQDIEITNVRDGRYCLSFEANPARRVVERRYANNSASRLLDITTNRDGVREIDVVAGSFRGSATCGITAQSNPDAGPDPMASALVTFTPATAGGLAVKAVKKAFSRPTDVTRRCSAQTVTSATCRVGFLQAGARYSGKVKVSQRLRVGGPYWYYSVSAERVRIGKCARSSRCPREVKTRTLLGGALGSNAVAAKRALGLPVTGAAPLRPGVAWPDSALPPEGRASIAEYRKAG